MVMALGDDFLNSHQLTPYQCINIDKRNNMCIVFLQRLLDTLEKDEDKQKKRLGEMTRKITVLRVNEKSLSRRYTAMQEVEAALRRENKKYKNDVVAMETAITERLGYLQRHKVQSLFTFWALTSGRRHSTVNKRTPLNKPIVSIVFLVLLSFCLLLLSVSCVFYTK